MINNLEYKRGQIEPGRRIVDEIVDPVSGDHVFIVGDEALPHDNDQAVKVNRGLATHAIPKLVEWGPKPRDIATPAGLTYNI